MKSPQQKKTNTAAKSNAPLLSGRLWFIWVFIIVGIVVLATLKERYKPSPIAEPTTPAVSTNATARIAQAKTEIQKLKGRLLRPDGG